ncbi:hypothetical protein [Streptomyces acidicola]|uniref:hypothetical protein n=1 Tax=Streptomyces acidicola TaxID=2596892 RepID=UPI00381694AF
MGQGLGGTLQAVADTVHWDTATGQMAQNKIAAIVAAKGGAITVGDEGEPT